MSEVTTTPRERNPLVLVGAVVGGLLVLGLLWLFVLSPLLAGDEVDDDSFDPTAGIEQPTEPDATATEDDTLDEVVALPIETYEIFLSRDPFEPVIPAPAAGGTDGGTDGGTTGGGTDGGTTGGGTDGGTDGGTQQNAVLIDVFTDDGGTPRALIRVGDLIYTVGEGDTFANGYVVVAIEGTCVTLTFSGDTFTLCEGGTPGGSDGGGNGGTDGCSGSDEVVCDGRVVTLVDVFTEADGTAVAVVQVDSTIYEVRDGDQFAENFQVVAIDPPCVTLLFGDDAFTLCEGERTLK